MQPREAVSFSYAVFSFVLDEASSSAVKVGVALWSEQTRAVKMRLIDSKEKLKGIDPHKHLPIVRLVHDQIHKWTETGRLPHTDKPMPPWTDAWWNHVRELLVHQVRLSEPRPIDCHDPEQELEPLYESVVAPHRPAKEQRTRIDGEIRKCLNGLASKFKGHQALPGYGHRNVPVLRAYQGSKQWVVIEGVNLAAPKAEEASDALASKLLRLREGLGKNCEIIVGYLASPEGLNGEAVLVKWIQEQTKARTFDLMKDRAPFRAAADESVARADGQKLIH